MDVLPQGSAAARRLLSAVLTLSLVLAARVAPAQYCSPDQCDECNLKNCHLPCCYEAPELWLVNTRCNPKCSCLDEAFASISIKRYDPQCKRFVPETYESFLAQEATMPTLIFSHGNTLKHKGAMDQCWAVYNKMKCCPGQKRLVFWSWPAQIAIKRPLITPRKLILANLRIKLVYSEYQGYYTAKFIQGMSMTQRVTVGGHSYGAIIAAVSAHFLGGGELRGLSLSGAQPVLRPNLRVALVSGAFDNDALYPGCRYGQAFVAAEKIYLTRNACDSTLKNWPDVSCRGRKAVGVTGLDVGRLGEYGPKLCQHTLTSDVGKSHYITPHLGSARFMSALCCIAFPKCAACAAGEGVAESEAPATPSELSEALENELVAEPEMELGLEISDPSSYEDSAWTASQPEQRRIGVSR